MKKKKTLHIPPLAFASVIVLSLVFGALGGSLASYELLGSYNRSETNAVSNKTVILQEDSATIDVVKRSGPAVVSIVVSQEVRNPFSATGPNIFPFDSFFGFGLPYEVEDFVQEDESGETPLQQVGAGSGFIVSSDGLVLTNKHVLSESDAQYSVVMQDGKKYDAEVLGADPINDIAVLKIIDPEEDLPVLELGDSDSVEIGQSVIAIGYALGEFPNSVTRGIISGIGRRVVAGNGLGQDQVLEQAFQTDAAINPGNSGGPLLNAQGEAIGINTAVSRSGQLIGFSIPINEAKRVVDSVLTYGRIVRPFLGVRYVIIDEAFAKDNNLPVDYGALIVRGDQPTDLAITPGSPADKAGWQENDILLELEGEQITRDTSLIRLLSNYQPGDEVEFTILQDGEEIKYLVVLDEFKQ